MLAVVLGILKVIGTILLVILLVVLALILLLLFWPFAYKFTFSKHGGRIKAEGKLYWLIRGIYAKGAFVRDEGKNSGGGEVYIFGIPLLKVLKGRKGSGKGSGSSPENKKGRAAEVSGKAKRQTSVKRLKAPGKHKTSENGHPAGRNADGSARKKPTAEPGRWKYMPDPSRSAGADLDIEITRRKRPGPLARLGAKISAFIGKIKKLAAGLKQKGDSLRELLDYLASESFASAKNGIISAVKVLISCILPRKIRGCIEYAMDDPAVTGEILAVIAVFYPVLPKGLDIKPDFEHFDEKKFEADVSGGGHFFLIVILVQVIKLLLNRDFRILIKKIRSRKKSR